MALRDALEDATLAAINMALQQCIVQERVTRRLLHMRATSSRQRVRVARVLERERSRLMRMLGADHAVDQAIVHALPPARWPWYFRISHRRQRLRMRGVRYSDVIKCYAKATQRDVHRDPQGPWRNVNVAVALMANSPEALQWLPDDLKDNKRVVRAAIRRRSTLIRHASERLRGDFDLAKMVVSSGMGRECLRLLMPNMQSNKAIILAAVSADGSAMEGINEQFHDDRDVVLRASCTFPALPLASQRLLHDDAFVRTVSRHCLPTLIGPNLMPFLEETAKLQAIANDIDRRLLLCRVRLLSGRAVLTSFSSAEEDVVDWQRDCLGLHVLFPRGMPAAGTTMCNGKRVDMEAWRLADIIYWDLGLVRGALNEVSLVIS